MSLLLLVVLGLVYASWQWNRTVASKSSQTVDNVEIRLDSGGPFAVGRLEPGQSKAMRIFPRGEGALQASYIDAAKTKKGVARDIYVEASSGYRPTLTIGKSGTAQWGYEGNFLWPLRTDYRKLRR